MSIRIDMEVEGLQSCFAMLNTWKAMGARPQGVELRGIQREEDSSITNADLLEWHADGAGKLPKRDILTSSSADVEAIAQAFLVEADKELQRQYNQDRRRDKLVERSHGQGMGGSQYRTRTGKVRDIGPPPDQKKRVQQLAYKSLQAAMKTNMAQSLERLDNQRSNTGTIDSIDPESSYGKQKARDVGFVNPPLKKSGQIVDNLDSGGTGGKNIKVTTK